VNARRRMGRTGQAVPVAAAAQAARGLSACIATLVLAAALLVAMSLPGVASAGQVDRVTIWHPIGNSGQGRDIVAATFGSGSRHVLFVGGVHGDEYGAGVAEQFARWLYRHPAAVPKGTRIDIIACANPDGRKAKTRWNAAGVDLNRNFPSKDWRRIRGTVGTAGKSAGSEPETKVVVQYLKRRYWRVVSLHSKGPLIDYDGPNGIKLAQKMAKAAHTKAGKVPNQSEIRGSMGRYVPEVYKIPIATWELASPVMDKYVLAGLLAAVK
jgi:protein MpaA